LREIFAEAGIPFVYKTSFDKANRTAGGSYRGVGLARGLEILRAIRESVACRC
jgi:2-dehydro-3-deoxyphosphooctonate aldolase (KDO 8-P synthase)